MTAAAEESVRKGIVLLSMLVIATAAGLAARWAGGAPERILLTAGPTGLSGPAAAGSGYVRLGLHNTSDSMLAYELVRLGEGVDEADGMRAVRVMSRLESGDSSAARARVGGFYGGPVYVGPGETKWVGTTLPPGRYVAYAAVIAPQGPPVLHDGFLAGLELRAARSAAAEPAPAHLLTMLDFRFEAPRTVRAGRALWRVENRGQASHLAFFAKLRPGKTFDDLKAGFAAGRGGPPDAIDPAVGIRGVHALTRGLFNDVELDLTPGMWVIGCIIDGHHVLGMLRPLEVTR